MACGYMWESEYTSSPCGGDHECVLQVDHADEEHECDCGEVLTETRY